MNKGDGVDDYPAAQIAALKELVLEIKSRHPDITNANVVRHSDVDNSTFDCAGKKEKRKRDPGPKFPYAAFLQSLDQ